MVWFLKTTSLHKGWNNKPHHSYCFVGANHVTPTNLWGKPRHSYKSLGQTTSLLQIFGANHVTPTNLWGKRGYSYIFWGQTRLLLQIFGANQVKPTNLWGKSGYFYDSLGQILTQSQNPLDMLQIPQWF